MQNALTPSGAKATGLLSGPFREARLHLTLIYVGILVFVLFLSSTITYSTFSLQLERRFQGLGQARIERLLPLNIFPAPPRVEQVRTDLVYALISVNGVLLILGGIFSYWFAGITLEPIQTSFNRQKRFLSDASHELRTPLTILQTNLENEMVKQTDQLGIRAREIQSHLEEVTHMSQLVSDLLTLSRLDETSPGNQELIQLDLGELIKDTVERLLPIAEKRQIEIKRILPPTPLSIQANKELITRALSNIVKNAIFYNRPSGTITLHLEAEKHQAKLRIIDTGIGIAAEDLPHIFERFYRAEKSRSRQSGGSGLGLPIVQSIVQAIGGSITIVSEPNKGTIVTLLFPLPSIS